MGTRFAAAVVTFLLLALVPTGADAQTVSTTSNSGPGSLRDAILAASPGAVITFDPALTASGPVTITLTTGELAIAKDLTIQGPGAGLLTISGNLSSRIFNISGAADVTLSGLRIADGRAPNGGGIYAVSTAGTLNVIATTIAGNAVSGSTALGGGLYYQSPGKLTITDSTISNNTVTAGFNGQGGGVFIEAPGGSSIAEIVNCTFSGNVVTGDAFGLGGGINYSSPGAFVLSNSTIVNNSAVATGLFGGGGGVYNGEGVLTVVNSTIAGNTASGAATSSFKVAGGIQGSVTTLKNTIVALNTIGTAPALSGPDVVGPFTSQGYNVIGIKDGSTGFTATGDQTGTTASPVDPLLGPLAGNGGPTLTRTPLAGSPAIDAGDPGVAAAPPSGDQRAFLRVFNGRIDIGAVEAGSVGVVTTRATSLGAGTATLNGLAYLTDLMADVHFRIGADPTLTLGTDLPLQFVGAGAGSVPVNQPVGGLDLDRTYYFQLVLTNAEGQYAGRILSFILGARISVEHPVWTPLADGAAVDFGPLAEGTTSPAKTFTIRNTGDLPLSNLSIGVDGAHVGDYSVSAPAASTVAPGNRTTFTVSFTPAATGARSAAIHIASNVVGPTSPFDVAVTGTGVGSIIWTGPAITFTNENYAGSIDQLTSRVWLSRYAYGGLVNLAPNPDALEWAVGTTASIGSLSFAPYLASGGNGIKPPIGPSLVLHLISENIYLDIRILSWTDGANGGGFSYIRSTPAPVASDTTAPTISAAATSSPNAAGWYRSSVTVHFTCADAESGIPAGACPADQTLSAEGAAVTSTSQTVTDAAGNVSAASNVVTVKIDGTNPVVTYGGNAGTYSVDQTVEITCTPADALSGIASSTCVPISGPASGFGLGPHTYSASAIDNAGNSGGGTTTFTVVLTAAGFDTLISSLLDTGAAAGLITNADGITSAPSAGAKAGKLTAFSNQVDAFVRSGRLTAAQGALLIQLAGSL